MLEKKKRIAMSRDEMKMKKKSVDTHKQVRHCRQKDKLEQWVSEKTVKQGGLGSSPGSKTIKSVFSNLVSEMIIDQF